MSRSSVPSGLRFFTVPVGPPPVAIPPGKPIDWCRCGAAILLPAFFRQYRKWTPEEEAEAALVKEWGLFHQGPGHVAVRDYYRAACKTHTTGCRNCGRIPSGRKQFYCSDDCRLEFERDHFWGTARDMAMRDAIREGDPLRISWCTRSCGRWATEVNHITPLNGLRPHFGCCHHRDNLEALCHSCHLQTTAEQRAAGLIGRV